jgi:preprotein translocase subunit SecA
MAAVYRLRTVRIEPNRPCRRRALPTVLVATQDAKRAAVVEEVRTRLAGGQPVLVGTRSVHASIELSGALEAAGIPHRVLNALQNADEAALVASAGTPGAVTVATNMAGRGTDIPLDPAVVPQGGLHVVLTEWHESARIDRQLFGRCARQGDPGSCRAIVALDDEIVTTYAPGFARALAARYGARVPAWAGRVLRRVVQMTAEAENATQRRVTMWQDKQMRDQLAFSGSGE